MDDKFTRLGAADKLCISWMVQLQSRLGRAACACGRWQQRPAEKPNVGPARKSSRGRAAASASRAQRRGAARAAPIKRTAGGVAEGLEQKTSLVRPGSLRPGSQTRKSQTRKSQTRKSDQEVRPGSLRPGSLRPGSQTRKSDQEVRPASQTSKSDQQVREKVLTRKRRHCIAQAGRGPLMRARSLGMPDGAPCSAARRGLSGLPTRARRQSAANPRARAGCTGAAAQAAGGRSATAAPSPAIP